MTDNLCYFLAWRGGTTAWPVLLPWFDPFSSTYELNHGGHPDVEPLDGWVELSRNFGDGAVVAPLPHVVLYSKHTGEVRVFVFMPESSLSGNYLVATFGQTGAPTGIGAWADDKNPYFAEPDSSFTQVFVGQAPVTPYSWVMARFDARGFDPRVITSPDLFRASTLHIELALMQESELNLFGTLDLQGVATTGSVGITGRQTDSANFLTDAINGFASGKKYFTDTKTQIAQAQTFATSHMSAWWSSPLLSAAGALGSWAPEVAAVAGFVTAFIGGKRQPTPQPQQWRMDLTGSLKLQGTLQHKQPLLTLNLLVPGLNSSDGGTDEALGLIALAARPVIRYRATYMPCFASCCWIPGALSQTFTMDALPVVANEMAGVRIQKVEYALVSEESGPTQFSETPPIVSRSSNTGYPLPDATCELSESGARTSTAQQYTQIAVKVTLQPFDESMNGPDDLVLMRVYPAQVVGDFIHVNNPVDFCDPPCD